MRLVTSGANPVELRQGILAASGMIIEEIKKLAAPVGKNEVGCRVWESVEFYACVFCVCIFVFLWLLVCAWVCVRSRSR